MPLYLTFFKCEQYCFKISCVNSIKKSFVSINTLQRILINWQSQYHICTLLLYNIFLKWSKTFWLVWFSWMKLFLYRCLSSIIIFSWQTLALSNSFLHIFIGHILVMYIGFVLCFRLILWCREYTYGH